MTTKKRVRLCFLQAHSECKNKQQSYYNNSVAFNLVLGIEDTLSRLYITSMRK